MFAACCCDPPCAYDFTAPRYQSVTIAGALEVRTLVTFGRRLTVSSVVGSSDGTATGTGMAIARGRLSADDDWDTPAAAYPADYERTWGVLIDARFGYDWVANAPPTSGRCWIGFPGGLGLLKDWATKTIQLVEIAADGTPGTVLATEAWAGVLHQCYSPASMVHGAPSSLAQLGHCLWPSGDTASAGVSAGYRGTLVSGSCVTTDAGGLRLVGPTRPLASNVPTTAPRDGDEIVIGADYAHAILAGDGGGQYQRPDGQVGVSAVTCGSRCGCTACEEIPAMTATVAGITWSSSLTELPCEAFGLATNEVVEVPGVDLSPGTIGVPLAIDGATGVTASCSPCWLSPAADMPPLRSPLPPTLQASEWCDLFTASSFGAVGSPVNKILPLSLKVCVNIPLLANRTLDLTKRITVTLEASGVSVRRKIPGEGEFFGTPFYSVCGAIDPAIAVTEGITFGALAAARRAPPFEHVIDESVALGGGTNIFGNWSRWLRYSAPASDLVCGEPLTLTRDDVTDPWGCTTTIMAGDPTTLTVELA